MATSLTSPQLVFSAEKAIEAAHKAIVKVSLFSTNFTADAAQPGSTLKVPLFSPSTAAQFDASANNYATVDGSLTYPSVTFANHVKHTFAFTDLDFTEIRGGGVWENAGKASGTAVGMAIASAVSGLINKTNIPKSGSPFSSKNEVVFSSVTLAATAALRDKCAKLGIDPARTVLMLEPATFASLLALLPANTFGGADAIRDGVIPSCFGFKAVVENPYLTTTAAEYLVGALVPEDALAVAGRRVEVQSPKVYQEVGYTTDEASGLTLTLRRFGKPETGENFASVEALFGAALVQPAKCIRLVSQATA